MFGIDQLGKIEIRLATLEKQNRILRVVAIGSGLAFGLVCLGGGSGSPSTIDHPGALEAEKLVISKPGTKGSITIAIGEHGPYIQMSDATGRTRFDVYSPYDRGPNLRLMDQHGLPRIEASVSADGPDFRILKDIDCGCEDPPASTGHKKKTPPDRRR